MSAIAGMPKLLFGKGDSGDLRIIGLGKFDREAAPTAADIEDPVARLDRKLFGDVRALCGLPILKRAASLAKIATRILPVLVEEQFIQIV